MPRLAQVGRHRGGDCVRLVVSPRQGPCTSLKVKKKRLRYSCRIIQPIFLDFHMTRVVLRSFGVHPTLIVRVGLACDEDGFVVDIGNVHGRPRVWTPRSHYSRSKLNCCQLRA